MKITNNLKPTILTTIVVKAAGQELNHKLQKFKTTLMNWKKRKIVTAITALVTIGTLYATVGHRMHNHHNHGCHSHQSEHCQGEAEKVVDKE